MPTAAPDALDRIAVKPVQLDHLSAESIWRHREQMIEYSGDAFAALGDERGALVEVEQAVALALERWLYIGDRYVNGAPAIEVPVMRSDTYMVRAGTWVIVDHSWFPDFVTRRRGLIMAGQVLAVRDSDCAWRGLLIEEVLADLESEYDDGGGGTPGAGDGEPTIDEGDISNARVERILAENKHRIDWDHDQTIEDSAANLFTVTVDGDGPVLEARVIAPDARWDGASDTTPRQGYVEFVIDGDLTYAEHPDAVSMLFGYRLALYKAGVLIMTIECELQDYIIVPTAPTETPSTVGLVSSAEGQLIPDPDPISIYCFWQPQATDPDDYRYYWDVRVEWFVGGVLYLNETLAQRSHTQSSPIELPWNNFTTEVYARVRYENSAGSGPWKLSDTILI